MPARYSPASVGRPRPVPNFDNILAEADKDVQAAVGSLQSPRDTRARYTPTGRTHLDCLLPPTAADAASWFCHPLRNHLVFYSLLAIVDARLFFDFLNLLARISVPYCPLFICYQLSTSFTSSASSL